MANLEYIYAYFAYRGKERTYPCDVANPQEAIDIAKTQGAYGIIWHSIYGKFDHQWAAELGGLCKAAHLDLIIGFGANWRDPPMTLLQRATTYTSKLALGNWFYAEWYGTADDVRGYLALAKEYGFEWVCPMVHDVIAWDLRKKTIREALGSTLCISLTGFVLAGYVYGDPRIPHQGWWSDGRARSSLSGKNCEQECGLKAKTLRDYLQPMNVLSGGGGDLGLKMGTRVYAQRLGFKGIVIGPPFSLKDSQSVSVYGAPPMGERKMGVFDKGYHAK